MARSLTLPDDSHLLRRGDLLAFQRPRCSVTGRLIGTAGRGNTTHVAKLDRWAGEWYCVEVREWYGGRIVTLRSQVERYPGRIYVYRANSIGVPRYDAWGACRYMRALAGCDYGWGAILRASFSHLPAVRLFVSPSQDDELVTEQPPYCSQAIAMADRIGGGYDPVSRLADSFTEPADLVRSPFYSQRVGRLYWSPRLRVVA